MIRTMLFAAAVALAVAGCGQPVYRTSGQPLPVAEIERDRYLGRWHELARLPNRFEDGCVDVTAEYKLRPDGLISVLNTCREADGRVRDAEGRARFAGDDNLGKLKVSFFAPFWADYWVLERAPDYSWAIVGEPGGRYLWLLVREENAPDDLRADLTARIVALGYRPADLVWAGD